MILERYELEYFLVSLNPPSNSHSREAITKVAPSCKLRTAPISTPRRTPATMAPTVRWGILGTVYRPSSRLTLTPHSHWRYRPDLHSRPPSRTQDPRRRQRRAHCHSCCQLQQQRPSCRISERSGSTERCQSLRIIQGLS